MIAAINNQSQVAAKDGANAATIATSGNASSSSPVLSFLDSMMAAASELGLPVVNSFSGKSAQHGKADDDRPQVKSEHVQDPNGLVACPMTIAPVPEPIPGPSPLPVSDAPVSLSLTGSANIPSVDSNAGSTAVNDTQGVALNGRGQTDTQLELPFTAQFAAVSLPGAPLSQTVAQPSDNASIKGTDNSKQTAPAIGDPQAQQTTEVQVTGQGVSQLPTQPDHKILDAHLAALLPHDNLPKLHTAPSQQDTKAPSDTTQPAQSATHKDATQNLATAVPSTHPNVSVANQPMTQGLNSHIPAIPVMHANPSPNNTDVVNEHVKGLSGINLEPAQATQQSTSHDSDTDSQSQTSSDTQGQAPAAPAAQPTAVNPVTFSVDHTAAAAMQSVHAQAPTAPSIPNATTGTGTAIHTDRQQPVVPDNVAAPAPHTPLINTARLIQSVHETGMHVGIRTEEFGNVSITTSATRQAVTAQISLEHTDLAKTIAAGLPEMQARLGSDQPLEVRIATGAQAGQMDTGSNSAGNNADAQSGNQWRQGSTSNFVSSNRFAISSESQPIAAAVTRSADIISNSRLSVRA